MMSTQTKTHHNKTIKANNVAVLTVIKNKFHLSFHKVQIYIDTF
jgi:hypothetical protein